MYGITDHYFQTLHDFNTFGEGLEAFLPEQALRAKFTQDSSYCPGSCLRQLGRLRSNQVLQVTGPDSIRSAAITAFRLCCSYFISVCTIPTGYPRW